MSKKKSLFNLLPASALSIQYCWETTTFLLLKYRVLSARATREYLLYRWCCDNLRWTLTAHNNRHRYNVSEIKWTLQNYTSGDRKNSWNTEQLLHEIEHGKLKMLQSGYSFSNIFVVYKRICSCLMSYRLYRCWGLFSRRFIVR